MGFFDRISEGLSRSRDKFKESMNVLLDRGPDLDEEFWDGLEETLILSDAYAVLDLLNDEIAATFTEGGQDIFGGEPAVVLFVGINGTGKTTTVGKLAKASTDAGRAVILGSADTFRAAAIEQLEVWAKRAGVEMVTRERGADPASVCYDTLERAEATEAEVDDQMDAMAEHYTDYEDASAATKMKPENYMDMAVKATDAEGNNLPAISSESRLYAPAAGMLSEAFDEEIMGMKKGQTKEFTLEVPADEKAILLADQAGKTVNFEVTCNVVKKKVKPEITDEWAKETMGFENVEDMRKQITESLTMQKAQMMPRIKENAIMAQLVERFEGEAPAVMVSEAETQLLQDFFTQLQQAGMTFDAYLGSQGITSDQFKKDLKAQSADHVKEELALEAWARHKGFDITDEDIDAEFAKTGVEDPEALKQEWRDAGRLHLIRTGLLRQKAIEDLMENAKVTEVDFAAKAADEKKAKKPAKKKASKKKEEEAPAEDAE